MTVLTKSDFAKHIGKTRQYVNQLKNNGLLVMDGDRVNAEASIERIAALKDPAKQGVVDRHEQEKDNEVKSGVGVLINRRIAQFEIDQEKLRSIRRENDIADKKLLVADHAVSAVADGDVIIRNRLESLPDVLAPQLAAEADEQKIRQVLFDHVEQLLNELSRSFYGMVK